MTLRCSISPADGVLLLLKEGSTKRAGPASPDQIGGKTLLSHLMVKLKDLAFKFEPREYGKMCTNRKIHFSYCFLT